MSITRVPPLTAAQMADKAWAMLSAAVAAGRLSEARGWMRLYKELKPFAREEADAERRARMDREAEQAREAVALPLHCFSPPACNTSTSGAAYPPSPSGLTGGSRHADGPDPAPQPSTSPDSPVTPENDARTGDRDLAPSLHCFSPPECNGASPTPAVSAPPDSLPGKAFGDLTQDCCDAHLAPPLHCFSHPESNNAGPDP